MNSEIKQGNDLDIGQDTTPSKKKKRQRTATHSENTLTSFV